MVLAVSLSVWGGCGPPTTAPKPHPVPVEAGQKGGSSALGASQSILGGSGPPAPNPHQTPTAPAVAHATAAQACDGSLSAHV